jgi:hypothetical protein
MCSLHVEMLIAALAYVRKSKLGVLNDHSHSIIKIPGVEVYSGIILILTKKVPVRMSRISYGRT